MSSICGRKLLQIIVVITLLNRHAPIVNGSFNNVEHQHQHQHQQQQQQHVLKTPLHDAQFEEDATANNSEQEEWRRRRATLPHSVEAEVVGDIDEVWGAVTEEEMRWQHGVPLMDDDDEAGDDDDKEMDAAEDVTDDNNEANNNNEIAAPVDEEAESVNGEREQGERTTEMATVETTTTMAEMEMAAPKGEQFREEKVPHRDYTPCLLLTNPHLNQNQTKARQQQKRQRQQLDKQQHNHQHHHHQEQQQPQQNHKRPLRSHEPEQLNKQRERKYLQRHHQRQHRQRKQQQQLLQQQYRERQQQQQLHKPMHNVEGYERDELPQAMQANEQKTKKQKQRSHRQRQHGHRQKQQQHQQQQQQLQMEHKFQFGERQQAPHNAHLGDAERQPHYHHQPYLQHQPKHHHTRRHNLQRHKIENFNSFAPEQQQHQHFSHADNDNEDYQNDAALPSAPVLSSVSDDDEMRTQHNENAPSNGKPEQKLPPPATAVNQKILSPHYTDHQQQHYHHHYSPLLPTLPSYDDDNLPADLLADWQPFPEAVGPTDYAAVPRSGRHRGRHATPPSLPHLMPVPHSYPLTAVSASKVFRSLPDSTDYRPYSEHMHRMLAIQPQRHWPVKREAIVEGDLILGGLMMVHSREDTIMCGPIMPQGGIQALEAMLYTIDRINEHGLLPNITLGAHILDDCDKDSYGLEMAVDFIKGSISNIDDAEYHCNKTQVRKVISGVVGAASSVTSIQVANLLRLFRIPQVSFFSTSPELSNKQRFEYFSRTIPSDHYQVKAMVEIVKRMGWSYVSIIYEESNYGIKAFEELEELLARHNICIAIKEKLVKDSGVAEEIAYDNIVQKLLTKPRARGAIIFGSDQEVREVMRAVRRNNATGAFSWIGSDGWSARNLVSDGNEPEVEGTLSVQPQANPVKGFEEYFLNLTVENNQRNPWFVEFWEDHFQCRYPNSLSTPYNNYNRTCTTKEQLSNDTDFEDQLQFVSDAVMAFAYALRDMHRDLCGGRPSLCDAMKPTKGADLLKYLRKVQFEGLSGDHFRFDANGDGPARYNIIHFKQSAEGQYHWVKVGEYYEGELRLNMSEVQFKLQHPKPPESVCSLPCERGQAKKYVEGESCCWHCFNCSTYQIRHPIDETQCLTCQLGTLPDATKQFCQTIPEVYLRPESAWAIGAMAFSATGILVTLFVVGVFVRHNDTPIVRASGRELSYILLAGILMCYAVTFALVLKPTNIVCAIQRFSVGFCFTVVYAALLTKTNRIARIFKAGKQSAKRPSFISPKSQLVICSFLIFIQILINGVWMVIAPSHAMYHHPTREDNLLVCDSYIDASYMIAFFYPILLIVVCTVYAVLTRKIPEAFNESKHIGFTMYTTCVIWLAFVPLYFGTANHVPLRITSMSVTISLSASVTIACLFSPKLYIILIRPERNVRQSMMPPRYGNMHRTAGTGPSSMMAAAVVTAATCAQEEKIQKHITPTNTEHSTKSKKLCEMATQTIAITNIFTNLDSVTYNQIPYADQYVPNNNHHHQHHLHPHQPHNHNHEHELACTEVPHQDDQRQPPQASNSDSDVVANNNKINQQHHGNPNTNTATTTATTTNSSTIAHQVTNLAANVAAVAAISGGNANTPTLNTPQSLGNHIMLQQQQQPQQLTTTTTSGSSNANNDCAHKTSTATTSL